MATLAEVCGDSAFRAWIETVLRATGDEELAAYGLGTGDDPKRVWVATNLALHTFVCAPDKAKKGQWRTRGNSRPWSQIQGVGISWVGDPAAGTYSVRATVGIPAAPPNDPSRSSALLDLLVECMRRQGLGPEPIAQRASDDASHVQNGHGNGQTYGAPETVVNREAMADVRSAVWSSTNTLTSQKPLITKLTVHHPNDDLIANGNHESELVTSGE